MVETSVLYELKGAYLTGGDQLFHEGGPYHIDTRPLISRASKWTDRDLRCERFKGRLLR